MDGMRELGAGTCIPHTATNVADIRSNGCPETKLIHVFLEHFKRFALLLAALALYPASASAFCLLEDSWPTPTTNFSYTYVEFPWSVHLQNAMRDWTQQTDFSFVEDADPRALYWEAVNRGKFIRIALFLHMFGKDDVEKIRARAY